MADLRLNLPVHSHSTWTGDIQSQSWLYACLATRVRQTSQLEKEWQVKDELVCGRFNDDAAIIEKLHSERTKNKS